jgi:hypothetical protein
VAVDGGAELGHGSAEEEPALRLADAEGTVANFDAVVVQFVDGEAAVVGQQRGAARLWTRPRATPAATRNMARRALVWPRARRMWLVEPREPGPRVGRLSSWAAKMSKERAKGAAEGSSAVSVSVGGG